MFDGIQKIGKALDQAQQLLFLSQLIKTDHISLSLSLNRSQSLITLSVQYSLCVCVVYCIYGQILKLAQKYP